VGQIQLDDRLTILHEKRQPHVNKTDLEILDQHGERLLQGVATDGSLGEGTVGGKLQSFAELQPQGRITALRQAFPTQGAELINRDEVVRVSKHGRTDSGGRQQPPTLQAPILRQLAEDIRIVRPDNGQISGNAGCIHGDGFLPVSVYCSD